MGKETLSLCNHLVGLAAQVTQYCHLLERQGNFWAALRGSSAKPPGEVCAPGLPPLFPQQERDSAHIRVCPLFPKEGLTKVMTENFFAKPAKHNLSPETKWFPFPTPCLPPAFQIIVGRRALQPESRSDASALGPPTALDKPACSPPDRLAVRGSHLCSVPPQVTVFFVLLSTTVHRSNWFLHRWLSPQHQPRC